MIRFLPVLIGILALTGLLVSIYLATIYTDSPLPRRNDSSQACALGGGECEEVVHTPQSQTLGVPNSLLGVGYYAVILAAVGTRLVTGRWPLPFAMIALLIGGVAFSMYLLYSMLFVLRQSCPYCITAHAVNGALAVAFIAAWNH